MTDQETVRRSKQAQAERKALLADYYSKSELAVELGITERSLDRYHWTRSGPTRTKIGGRVYYHRSHVEAWLRQQEVPA